MTRRHTIKGEQGETRLGKPGHTETQKPMLRLLNFIERTIGIHRLFEAKVLHDRIAI